MTSSSFLTHHVLLVTVVCVLCLADGTTSYLSGAGGSGYSRRKPVVVTNEDRYVCSLYFETYTRERMQVT